MSMDTAPEAPARKSRRWLLVGFVASLVLNMLLIGIVAGARLHHGGGLDSKGRHWEFMRSLPEARREELRKEMDALRAELRTKRENIRGLRQAARDLIAKEPFDRAAVTSAIAAVSKARAEARGVAAERFVDLLSRMTAEERQAFIKLRGDRKGRHRDGGERDDL